MNPKKGSRSLRKGRKSISGQYYLLTTATHEKRNIFERADAAEIVLNCLHWLDMEQRIDLECAVVMPDHLHFVASLNKDDLSKVMHSLKSYSAKKICELKLLPSPIWQAQYHDHAIRKDEVLTEIILYCLNNPVRVNLVKDFHDYPHWYCRYQV